MNFSPFYAQNGNVIINKDKKIEKIIELKKEVNKNSKNLSIQIFSGSKKKSIAVLESYINLFNDSTAKLIYETPNYKVWVGNFNTMLEADRFLIKIRKEFPEAFIFRPK
jgi:hypothetical protein|tara:strand:+ start:33257 stop:33583 length:327 start_codon:yes stop_codon:yes gene_type:complete